MLDNTILQSLKFPQKFSFEKNFLELYLSKYYFGAYVSSSYFIDIGIPEDYLLAQQELEKHSY